MRTENVWLPHSADEWGLVSHYSTAPHPPRILELPELPRGIGLLRIDRLYGLAEGIDRHPWAIRGLLDYQSLCLQGPQLGYNEETVEIPPSGSPGTCQTRSTVGPSLSIT